MFKIMKILGREQDTIKTQRIQGKNRIYRNFKIIEVSNLFSQLETAELEGEFEEITQNATDNK